MMAEIPVDLTLTAPQARVLGCLMEKQATTPDAYPMTLKALTTACNQSSSRFPVVQYEPTLVEATLHALKGKGLIRIVHPAHGERATKYRHVTDEALGLEGAQRAIITLLLLRGGQTVAELKSRSERLFDFTTTGEVEATLRDLAELDPPAVAVCERQPGQKEHRWIQMLETDPQTRAATFAGTENTVRGSAQASASAIQDLQQRVSTLESRVQSLIDALADLVQIDEGPTPEHNSGQRSEDLHQG